MRRALLLLLSSGISGIMADTAGGTHPVVDRPIDVVLNGQNEVDPNGELEAGDADGLAEARLVEDHGSLIWQITFRNIDGQSISGLHIHGPGATTTTNRSIFIDLLASLGDRIPPTPPDGMVDGFVTFTHDPDIGTKMQQVLANPHEFYLNLHTSGAGGFPNGAVRGMLPEPGCLALMAVTMLLVQRRFGRG